MNAAHPSTTCSSQNRNAILSPTDGSTVKSPVVSERPFSVRGFTSLLLVLCLLMLLASGLTLYLAPRGRVANWTAWSALSLSRQQWVAVHINASICSGL